MGRYVVTGSASGIGAATVAALRGLGHDVIGVDRRAAEVEADLSTPEGRASALEALRGRCQAGLDGLVCCAGLGHLHPFETVLAVNYFGCIELIDGLFDCLRAGTDPAVVAIGSTASMQVGENVAALRDALLAGDEARARQVCGAAGQGASWIAYAASKHALTCAARLRAERFGQAGIRLNVIAPGSVQTPLYQSAADHPAYAEAIRRYVPPIARVGRPDEVADLALFLLSSRAAYVHGAVICIDGGITAQQQPYRF